MKKKENPMFRKADSLFLKSERLMELVNQKLPSANRHEVRKWLGRVANHYFYREIRKKKEHKKYKMSAEEAIVYNICIEQELNPWNCYKWFILLDAPQPIRDALTKKEISIRQAFAEIKRLDENNIILAGSKRKLHSMTEQFLVACIHNEIGTPNGVKI